MRRLGEVAHQPEQHAVQFMVGGNGQDQGDQCAATRRNNDAREQQAGLRPTAVAMREAEDQQHRCQGTGQRGAGNAPDAQPEQNGENRSDAGATGNTKNVRVGERIAQQDLQQGTCQRQQSAARETGKRARQTQAHYHFGRDAVTTAAAVGQHPQHVPQGNTDAAHHQGQHQADHRRAGQQGQNKQSVSSGKHGGSARPISYFGW